MAVAYQSIGLSPGATSNTCVVTAPTGIEVGDLLVAVITIRDEVSTCTPPSGWTQIVSQQGESSVTFRTYYKVAVSADTSATDYTFTFNGSERNKGAIVRINGQATSDFINTYSTGYSNSSTTTAECPTVTPTVANCLFILCGSNVQGSANYSAWAMTTSDPGFTERMDAYYSNSTSIHLGIATSAVRPETSATGTFTYTQGNETYASIAIAIAPYVVSGPTNLKSYNTNLKANIKSINTNLIANVKSLNTNT